MTGVPLVFQSQKMLQLLERVRRFARCGATVLLQGESGTGKELLARLIHQHSPRRHNPYLRVNCSALSLTLIESELFGHEAGSFTGAQSHRVGRLEETAAGTVLLDEVGELPLPLQAKLLRVLEEREFQRVGSNQSLRFEGRVVAATNRDLQQEVREGLFRGDLYHRLNVLTLEVPPLRQRPEDIPALVNHFIQQSQPELEQPVREVSRRVMQQLCDYPWPGNVRELKNVILRCCLLSTTSTIERIELPTEAEAPSEDREEMPSPFDRLPLDEIERRIILHRIQRFRGNKTEAAADLGVTSRTLRNKVSHYRRLGFVH
ncbi:sigma-54 interaction domain-containing protein [Planctomicrobium sp. SH664]|uniref:sigma-54 interaction domain-containing protein n=1 Tax=Planctomicrobium sp. SH664 TaxID=3448125 RepID=UPI003F5B54BD